MKKKISIAFISIIVIFAISLPITRYQINEEIRPSTLPESISDLDAYLFKSEEKFGDVVSGAEKKIFWASNSPVQTKFSIVYIHGFSSSRQETAPLGDLVAKNIKANIYYARLTGHARKPEEFSNSTANDWLNDAVEAIEIGKKIGKKVILMGGSTGCTLIVWLISQEKYKKDVSSVVFISPNFYPASKMTKIFLYPAGVEFAKLVYGKERVWEPRNEQMRKFWNHKYRWEGLTPMIVLVEHIQNLAYSEIQIPSLFLYTEQDKVVDTKEIIEKFNLLGSKDKKLINLSQVKDHVMAGDIVCPESTDIVYNEITSFLNQIGIK